MKLSGPKVLTMLAVWAVIACSFLVTELDRRAQMTLHCQLSPYDPICPKE